MWLDNLHDNPLHRGQKTQAQKQLEKDKEHAEALDMWGKNG